MFRCDGISTEGLHVSHSLSAQTSVVKSFHDVMARIAKATNYSWSERRLANQLRTLADKMDPKIRRAFMQSVKNLKDAIPRREVADALARGKAQDAMQIVDEVLEEHGMPLLIEATRQAARESGKVGAEYVEALLNRNQHLAPRGAQFIFDMVNPRTAAYLTEHGTKLVREITNSARRSVELTITESLRDGIGPVNTARRVRDAVGLTERQTQAVANYRRLLESRSEDALARSLRDRRFDATVSRAITSGVPLSEAQIARMSERYQERMESYRALTIARTESIRAVSAAQGEVWEQAAAEGWFPKGAIRRYWFYTADGKARESHVAIPELNPDGVGLDEPFETPEGTLMFPGDPDAPPEETINCRCVVVTRFVPEAA